MTTRGVEEARGRLPELPSRANRDGAVTVVTDHCVREARGLSALRGSGRGCYGEAAEYVDRIRDEWR